ncbi:MAG: 3-oxoacyl-ACP reductase FabG [Actinomycetota bacterium]|nr:3-oxoacyl-ACP reductase FabG [Actinomycetota bacterium]
MSRSDGRPEGAALVTGASAGIGAAIARRIAAAGWPVGVHFRSGAEGAVTVVKEIESAGGRAVAVGADLDEPDAADRLVTEIEEKLGTVLVLVNNAGRRADDLAPRIGDDRWNSVIETNLSAPFRLTRRTLGPMLRARFGRIVNIASIVGPQANPGQANYAASKAGLIGMTRTVAAEVARRGITVNAVAPGFVETSLTADIGADAFLERIPARRAGTADEIAACVDFLTSEDASYVTGTTLTVDGGLTA